MRSGLQCKAGLAGRIIIADKGQARCRKEWPRLKSRLPDREGVHASCKGRGAGSDPGRQAQDAHYWCSIGGGPAAPSAKILILRRLPEDWPDRLLP